MSNDLQKAGFWKRIAAWMFDGIFLSILAVGLGVLLSGLLGYDSYSAAVDEAYRQYETEYGIVFEITQEEYDALSAEKRYYKVRKGDYLGLIAKRNHTTVGAICRLNGIKPTTTLQIGRVLRVK